MKKEKYINLLEKSKLVEDKMRKNNLSFSISRLVIALLFLLFLILYLVFVQVSLLIVSITFLVAFIIVAIFHYQHEKKYTMVRFRIEAIKKHIDRFSNDWKAFPDKGEEFLKEGDYLATDLDLFGTGSLFQFINLAKTPMGRTNLAGSLTCNMPSIKNLEERQKAIAELTEDTNKSLNIEVASLLFQKKRNNYSVSTLKGIFDFTSKEFGFKKFFLVIGLFLSLLTWVALILGILKLVPISLVPLFFIIDIFYAFLLNNKCGKTVGNINVAGRALDGYDEIAKIINIEEYEANILKDTKKSINIDTKQAIKRFKFIMDLISSRKNILFFLLGNICFSIDALCYFMYSKWQKKNGLDLKKWIEAIALFEELNSLAIVGQCRENATIPVCTTENIIEFENLTHPLIAPDEAIGNDFRSINGINIITGSNMSGKTTFMRTIGLTMILFMAGSYVNGTKFVGRPMKVFTSMRVVDDTMAGISTFYAEINRIKTMIEYLKQDKEMMVLIDEIFKGTNSQDRIAGAELVIKRFVNKKVIGIVSTHDLELCSIENISNYHFEEYYENDKIYFDYKLKNDVSKTRNAKFLMRMAGLIE